MFSTLTDLRINTNKSSIIRVGQDMEAAAQIASDLDCSVDNFPFVYLGIILGSGILDCNGWDSVMDMLVEDFLSGSVVISP